jgi:hypothetical protein
MGKANKLTKIIVLLIMFTFFVVGLVLHFMQKNPQITLADFSASEVRFQSGAPLRFNTTPPFNQIDFVNCTLEFDRFIPSLSKTTSKTSLKSFAVSPIGNGPNRITLIFHPNDSPDSLPVPAFNFGFNCDSRKKYSSYNLTISLFSHQFYQNYLDLAWSTETQIDEAALIYMGYYKPVNSATAEYEIKLHITNSVLYCTDKNISNITIDDSLISMRISKNSKITFDSYNDSFGGSIRYYFKDFERKKPISILLKNTSDGEATISNLYLRSTQKQENSVFLDYGDSYTEIPVIRKNDSLYVESKFLILSEDVSIKDDAIYVSCSGNTKNASRQNFQLVDDKLERFPQYLIVLVAVVFFVFDSLLKLVDFILEKKETS